MKLKLKIIVILFSILMVILVGIKIRNDLNPQNNIEQKTKEIFSSINTSSFAKITKYIVYGTNFNLEGKIEIPQISKISVSKVNLIVQDLNGEQKILKASYKYSDGVLNFSTIEEINNGINLEKLNSEKYFFFIEVIFSNNEKYNYSLKNETEYGDITYYTITKNNTNKVINIGFNEYNDISYMGAEISDIENLPDDIYDIVIDARHGGKDTGTKNGEYNEADIVLDCSNILKAQLEEMGYKVFVTRDETMGKDVDTTLNMYDDDGRVNIANNTHAKILISLHIDKSAKSNSGVEIYAPCLSNLNFAKSMADNIVKYANTSYSSSDLYKEDDGVYVRNYRTWDILEQKNAAIRNKYEPYNITTSTPFLYMIRECGGIATNAFVDGRNKVYGKNNFVNSNIGIETYVVELGNMINNKDLENVVNHSDLYMKGISESIQNYYN